MIYKKKRSLSVKSSYFSERIRIFEKLSDLHIGGEGVDSKRDQAMSFPYSKRARNRPTNKCATGFGLVYW